QARHPRPRGRRRGRVRPQAGGMPARRQPRRHADRVGSRRLCRRRRRSRLLLRGADREERAERRREQGPDGDLPRRLVAGRQVRRVQLRAEGQRQEPERAAPRIPGRRGAGLELHHRRRDEEERVRPGHDRREVLEGTRLDVHQVKRVLLSLAVAALAACAPGEEPPISAAALPVVKTDGGAEMILIPEGDFEMGSPRGREVEQPVHKIHVDAFLIDRTEVTQEQYEKFKLPNPSRFKGPTLPVEMIPWTKAALFCNVRSKAERLEPCYNEDTAECDFSKNGYRLPTEAEWEYACRAGTKSDYSFGDGRRKG